MILLLVACNVSGVVDAPPTGVPILLGPPGPLLLTAPDAIAGALMAITVTGAFSGERVALIGASGAPAVGPCPPVLDGACMGIPAPLVFNGVRTADDDGTVVFTVRVPNGREFGDVLSWQAVADRPEALLSNALATPVVAATPPSLAGSWLDEWGTQHHINALEWEDGYGNRFWLTEVDEAAATMVAQNDKNNAFAPKAWSRFDWAIDGHDTYYCQAAWDAVGPAEALAEPATDPTSLDTGCDGFPWTRLDAEVAPIVGDWTDEWGTAHTITELLWTDSYENSFDIADASVLGAWLVAQNGDDNAFFAGSWSRFDWTTGPDGHLFYCQSAFSEDTEQQARVARPGDPSDLAAGCGGFAWTNLTP